MPNSSGIQTNAHRVAVLAPFDVVPFDLSVPCDTFRHAWSTDGDSLYEVRVCAETLRIDAGPFAIEVSSGLEALNDADTIVIAGTRDLESSLSSVACGTLRAAADRGARIASICSGAFLLASTGLLDGRRATTHWRAAPRLAERFPDVTVDPDVLYIDEGQFLTSAGAAAALDLCLHMVRKDFGATTAARVARLSVMPLEREGGQAQFVSRPSPVEVETLTQVLAWIEDHASDPLTLGDIAAEANVSVRTLTRRFKDQLGVSPLQWLIRVRIEHAQRLLETSDLSIERIAEATGFGSTPTFRQHFKRLVTVSPKHWRQSFAARRPH
ncbi:MAG: helix-turn-helix domain-containing protein [Myxococcota bacterium]